MIGKRKTRLIGLVLMTALVLAACGGSGGGTTATEPAGDTGATTPTTAGTSDKVPIRWFVGLGAGTEPGQIDVQNQVVADFNASHPDIELTIEIVPYDSARDVLATQIASGAGPDVIGPVGWSGSNAFYGQWLDMTDVIASSGYDTTQFSDVLVSFYQTEEGQVGLPFAVFPAAVFYQKPMFDEIGLNYPPASYGEPYVWPDGTEEEWSWETLTKVARMLTVDVNGNDATSPDFDADQIIQYGYVNQWQDLPHIAAFFEANSLATADGTAQVPPAWEEAWRWFFDGIWGDQPFIPNAAVVESPDFGAGNPFGGGKIAMTASQLWYTCCVGDAGDGWDLAALPSYNGEVHGRVDADTFRIWKGTAHPEETFEVVSYLIGEASADLLTIYAGMPAREGEQDAFFAGLAGQYPFVENWEVMKAGLDYPDIPSAEGYMPNWNEAWDRVGTFGGLLANEPTTDFDTELEKLVTDLQVIFDK